MTNRLSQTFCLPDNRTLMYAEYGLPDGKPVFYFHGLSGSRLEAGLLDENRLAEAGIRLVACDRPGMGGSDFQPGRTLRDWVNDVSSLANGLGFEKFSVFGVSGGAGYVYACAALIPERLSAAVVASGLVDLSLPGVLADFPALTRWMYRLAARSAPLMEGFMNLSRPRNLGDPEQIRQQMKRGLPAADAAVFQMPGRLEAFMASGAEAMRPGMRGIAWDTHVCSKPWDFKLEEIRFPVRMIHGEADRNVPVAAARRMAAALPHCQASFYPGEGHFSTILNHLDQVMEYIGNTDNKNPRTTVMR